MRIKMAAAPIDTKHVFCQAYNNANGQFNNYQSFLNACEVIALASSAGATQNALNNVRGAWYAWILAIEAIRFNAMNQNSNYLIKLPNISQFDSTLLYKQNLSDLISDFKIKLSAIGNVNLITSNPDYVIIKNTVAQAFPALPSTLSDSVLDLIDGWYRSFISQCMLDDIIGYVGAKVSVRPDRRIQLLHEGSLSKAIYAHLQTRNWLINAPGIKYYAVSMSFTDADKNGLRSVATHSIASAALKPEPAVDDVVSVFNTATADTFFRSVLI